MHVNAANRGLAAVIGASVLLVVASFENPLRLSGRASALLSVLFSAVAFVFILFGLRWTIEADRQKRERQGSNGMSREEILRVNRTRIFWMTAAGLIAGSISSDFLLPYTMGNYIPAIYYFVVPFQIVLVLVALAFLRKKLRVSTPSP